MWARARKTAPFACAVLWATQTLAVRAYVVSGHRVTALGVVATVAAAETIKAGAAASTTAWNPSLPQLRLLICAFCSVICSSMVYVVLERVRVMVYLALLGCHLPLRLAVTCMAHGGVAYSHARALAAIAGVAAFVAGAQQCAPWSAAVVLIQVRFAGPILQLRHGLWQNVMPGTITAGGSSA